MPQVYYETEHQEVFGLRADLYRPIPVHIPSALAKLGYFICLRVARKWTDCLEKASCRLTVGGRRPVDLTLRLGQNFDGPMAIASKARGQTWVIFARALAARGDGKLSFTGLPRALRRGHVLLCTWLRFVQSGQADDYIQCRKDPLWAPNGVPLGGIGCGKVEICRDGRFRNFSANNNQDMPLENPAGLPGALLTLSADGREKVLASRGEGGLPPCPQLSAEMAFPQAMLKAPGIFPGLDAEVLLSGPIVPHDLKTSSLPGFLVRWTVRNRSHRPRRVRCRLAWPNLVGAGGGIGEPEKRIGYADGSYRYWEAPEAPEAKIITRRGFTAVRYGNRPSDVSAAADGYHFVAARAGRGRIAPLADPRYGSIACELAIPARSAATTDMAVVWEMPHWIDALGIDRGHYWQNSFSGGLQVLAHLFRRADRILQQAGELWELVRASNLPDWLQHRLVNCCYPLTTNSVFYRDGRFSINEGPTEMAGCHGTLDQRLGSHPATQLLFPRLNRNELEQFGRFQADDGGVNHDLGAGHLDRGASPTNWPDLTCSFIIQNARHAWSTAAADFEPTAYERSKKALRRHAQWAREGNGLAQLGEGMGTSYDGYQYYGSTPYLGTLWIAAMHVMRQWGQQHDDAELIGQIDQLLPAAQQRMDQDLWTGRYYRACGSVHGPQNDNCHAGMLAGQWYARMLTGLDVLPPDRLQSCASALLEFNGHRRFRIPPDEVSPDGQAATEFGWLSYVECFGLAALASLRTGGVLPLWRRMLRHMTGRGRMPCDTRLMYRPATGEPSWGAYYMTAPASWLVYEALLDFVYWPAEGVLRLCPQLRGSFPLVHPLFWAAGRHSGRQVSIVIRRTLAKDLRVVYLDAPQETRALKLCGRCMEASVPAGRYKRFRIPPLALRPGQELWWSLM